MSKIKNLKLKKNVYKYIGNGCALISAGYLGTSIAFVVTEQSNILPLLIASGWGIESILFYMHSSLNNIEIENEKIKEIGKTLEDYRNKSKNFTKK